MGIGVRVTHPDADPAAVRGARTALVRAACLILSGIILLMHVPDSGAQVPVSETRSIPAADSLFTNGLTAYEHGNYVVAYNRFLQIVDGYSSNRMTTAAVLMAARSAYRAEQYSEVLDLTANFDIRFPSSGYVNDVHRVEELARRALQIRTRTIKSLGVILSLDSLRVAASQEMFNGIRLAVDDFNQRFPATPVRLVFRDTDGGEENVRSAVRDLAAGGVSTVIGTIFSEDAEAAADEAEKLGLVFVAPLATDSRVSAGRRYAFQANPTIEMRGRMMARFAIYGLRIDRLGIVARETPDGIGTTLTDSFIRQASEMGAEINFVTLLPDEQAWFQIDKHIEADTLNHVDALYIPLVTDEPVSQAGSILSGLDRLGRDIRVLGNSGWHNLPMRSVAGKYLVTYSNDFFPRERRPYVLDFRDRYSNLTGLDAGRIAFTGYDVTTFVLSSLEARIDQADPARLRNAPEYSGLGLRIHFDGGQVNKALFYHRYRNGRLALIR